MELENIQSVREPERSNLLHASNLPPCTLFVILESRSDIRDRFCFLDRLADPDIRQTDSGFRRKEPRRLRNDGQNQGFPARAENQCCVSLELFGCVRSARIALASSRWMRMIAQRSRCAIT